MEKNEEYQPVPPVLAWILVFVLSGILLTFGMIIHMNIPDPPRQWDFGALPDTPASSIFATQEAKSNEAPSQQMPTMPNAKSLEGAKR